MTSLSTRNAWLRPLMAGALFATLAACGTDELGPDGSDGVAADGVIETDDEAAANGVIETDDEVAGLEQASTTCTYPSQILDTSRWKLQLPFGSPIKEVSASSLESYTHIPDFRTSTDCTWVRFRAPTNGTTTSGSEYPRSELREMKSDGKTKAAWSSTSGTHTMFIDQKVTALPKGRRQVIVGQIHDDVDDVVTVRVEGTRLYVKAHGGTAKTLDSNYTLGKRFTIKMVVSGGYVKVYYNGSSTSAYTVAKKTTGNYFKAGVYTQSNCDTEADAGETCGSSNYGEAQIKDLWITHK